MAQAARRAGLVDRIGDRTAYGQRMAELAGTAHANVPGSFRAVQYRAWVEDNPPGEARGQIGVLTIAGDIVDGHAGRARPAPRRSSRISSGAFGRTIFGR
jgi:protease-4